MGAGGDYIYACSCECLFVSASVSAFLCRMFRSSPWPSRVCVCRTFWPGNRCKVWSTLHIHRLHWNGSAPQVLLMITTDSPLTHHWLTTDSQPPWKFSEQWVWQRIAFWCNSEFPSVKLMLFHSQISHVHSNVPAFICYMAIYWGIS